MASRTEAITLRLWKLKAATMDLDILKNHSNNQHQQHPTTPSPPAILPLVPITWREILPENAPVSSDEDRNSSSSLTDDRHHHTQLKSRSFDESGTHGDSDSSINEQRITNNKEHINLHSSRTNIARNSTTTAYMQSPTPTTASEASPIKETSNTPPLSKKNEDLKPTQSYIALIATAILKAKDKRLVLSDIYKHILDNYSYFQSQDKSWRNSIRHNLSLNECFIKVGRSEQGKGHYWAIHPANYDDFLQGDFRRRRARRRVRRSFLDNRHPYTGYPLRPYTNVNHQQQPFPCSTTPPMRIYNSATPYKKVTAAPGTVPGASSVRFFRDYQRHHLAESFMIRTAAAAASVDPRRGGHDEERIPVLETSMRSRYYEPIYHRLKREAPFSVKREDIFSNQNTKKDASPTASPVDSSKDYKRHSPKAAAFSIDSLLGNIDKSRSEAEGGCSKIERKRSNNRRSSSCDEDTDRHEETTSTASPNRKRSKLSRTSSRPSIITTHEHFENSPIPFYPYHPPIPSSQKSNTAKSNSKATTLEFDSALFSLDASRVYNGEKLAAISYKNKQFSKLSVCTNFSY